MENPMTFEYSRDDKYDPNTPYFEDYEDFDIEEVDNRDDEMYDYLAEMEVRYQYGF